MVKVGDKVHVFSVDKGKDLGIGTIIKLGGEPLGSIDYPTIKLSNGKVIGGIDCWWKAI